MKELTKKEISDISFWIQDAYWPKKRDEVLKFLEPIAEEGNAVACELMGRACIHDCRIGKDRAEEARQWLRKAAEGGCDVLFSLASILEDPDERERCYLRYIESFDDEKLAYHGLKSKNQLLEWLANGLETWGRSSTLDREPDHTVAVRLWQRIIDSGNDSARAHMYLGKSYLEGLGVERNPEKAFAHIKYAYDHRGAPSTSDSIWEDVPELYAECLRYGIGTEENLKEAGEVMQKFHEDWDYLDEVLSR